MIYLCYIDNYSKMFIYPIFEKQPTYYETCFRLFNIFKKKPLFVLGRFIGKAKIKKIMYGDIYFSF